MIRVFSWNATTKQGTWGKVDELPGRDALPDVLWVDLEAPTTEEERRVFEQFFPVHVLTLEDIQRLRRIPDHPPHFPKVEEFPDYLFVVVNPLLPGASDRLLGLSANNGDRIATQLSAVLTERILITHHYESLVAIKELTTYIHRHEEQCKRGPDFLFQLVLDSTVDEFAPLLDSVDNSLDALEIEVFTRPSQELLERLLQLKRGIITLRKTMIYERELLARMSRGEFRLIDEREMVYYRNVYDHLIRFTELIEASREMVGDLMQAHLAAQANKLNSIMKVLTMISTTILPMALIAGIYGMNFENNIIPDFRKSDYGFWWVLLLMALSGLGSLGFFRWMKWL